MENPEVVTPEAAEIVSPTDVTPETPATPEVAPEAKVGDIIEAAQPVKADTVPLSTFLDVKNDNKQLRNEIKELRDKVEAGATAKEVTNDLSAISEKYGVDPSFMNDLAASIKSEMEAKLRPFEEKEKQRKIDDAFNKHFAVAMDKMPEYEGIVNKEVIKTLSLNPANANKTLSEIIEETYPSSILPGKRTMDTTKPGGGKEPQPLDFDKARKDTAYFSEVMADPKLKAEYNDQMLKRGF